MELPKWLVDAAVIAAAVATVGLTVATLVLAFATRKLANTALDESKHIATQADATIKLAQNSAAQLDELKKQNTQRPLFVWEQRGPPDAIWEPGAETVAPKSGKRVTFRVMLRAENLGGAAVMGDARLRYGGGAISFESPRKLVPIQRDYFLAVSFDAIGGTPYRKFATIAQVIRSWNTGESFTAHVLVAVASDWYDMNDPQVSVVPLEREEKVDEDTRYWAEQHFANYDDYVRRAKGA
jgi:hypothetical protein